MSGQIADAREPSPRAGGRAAAAVAALATAALACGACCALPFALPPAVLALGGGLLAWFAKAQMWAWLLALLAVASAWVWAIATGLRTRRRPAWRTLATLAAATAVLAAAVFVGR